MLQRYHFIHNWGENTARVEKREDGPYVKWDDILPVLREARAIAEVLERITHCKSGWNKQAKSFLELAKDIDATKGVEG